MNADNDVEAVLEHGTRAFLGSIQKHVCRIMSFITAHLLVATARGGI